MRLATFNLLHGRSVRDGEVDPDRLARAVRALDADVLAIQEVDREQPRSAVRDLTGLVAEAMDAQAWRFEPTLLGTPGEAWRRADDADPGHRVGPAYGVGLVSRFPVRRWQPVPLPRAPVRSPVYVPGARPRLLLLEDEPRVGLAAVVEAPAGLVTIATTHLSFVPLWNAVQLRLLTRRLSTMPGPRVLLGDLNLPGPLPRLLTGWRSLGVARTYPSWRPRVQLDHILASGPLPPVLGLRTPELELSDHRALVVDLGGLPAGHGEPAASAGRSR